MIIGPREVRGVLGEFGGAHLVPTQNRERRVIIKRAAVIVGEQHGAGREMIVRPVADFGVGLLIGFTK